MGKGIKGREGGCHSVVVCNYGSTRPWVATPASGDPSGGSTHNADTNQIQHCTPPAPPELVVSLRNVDKSSSVTSAHVQVKTVHPFAAPPINTWPSKSDNLDMSALPSGDNLKHSSPLACSSKPHPSHTPAALSQCSHITLCRSGSFASPAPATPHAVSPSHLKLSGEFLPGVYSAACSSNPPCHPSTSPYPVPSLPCTTSDGPNELGVLVSNHGGTIHV